ncbi:copper chaperone PCu(A)C [Yinghuangia seranimata]|uniref:copper chaperone PCu(A)C n=1 Tax=Yinghuangia seranimata TaxID=408067 RepID=UPI00248BCC65|nr:copper chaperone PCu(A)C [Yinghuangia seranimata]MDI2125606.1 copper chaperone PCu(A)C [Yinghuangia seranimata]
MTGLPTLLSRRARRALARARARASVWLALLRPAAAPIAAALAAVLLLSAWASSGAAGRARPLRVQPGVVLLPTSDDAQATSAFFRIENPGDVPDDLIEARTDAAARVELSTHKHAAMSGTPRTAKALAVPPRGRLAMSPMGDDLVLIRPHKLAPGERVEFTLRFRRTGEVRISAVAVRAVDLREALTQLNAPPPDPTSATR